MRLGPGEGLLEIAPGGAVTTLAASSPLALLTPKNHGRAAWVFLANLGGGLVDGDLLSVDVKLAAGAQALLATQSSTKVYPGSSGQRLTVDVGDEALLVSLPDPVVCYAGARYRQEATIQLGHAASLIWLEPFAAGRVEHGEAWAFARLESRVTVSREGRVVLADGLLLDPRHGELATRFGRFHALATLVAIGPAARTLRSVAGSPEVMAAQSPLGDDGVVVRLAAVSTQHLDSHLRSRLVGLAQLLGDDPFARKW